MKLQNFDLYRKFKYLDLELFRDAIIFSQKKKEMMKFRRNMQRKKMIKKYFYSEKKIMTKNTF